MARYVKTLIHVKANKTIEIYAGTRVADALDELSDLDVFKGAKVLELIEVAYEQGKKNGARLVRDEFACLMKRIPHANPGRPKRAARSK
jgi:hypothetical protein